MPEPLEIIALQSAPMVVVAQLHRHQITGQLSNNRMAAREAADSANIGATVATARAATAPGPSADSFDVDETAKKPDLKVVPNKDPSAIFDAVKLNQ